MDCTSKKSSCLKLRGELPIDIHDTLECAGTVIGTKHVTIYYLILRGIFTCYSLFIIIWALTRFIMQNAFLNFFTYVTSWGLIMNTTYFVTSFILNLRVYLAVYKIDNIKDYPSIPELNLSNLWHFVLYFLDTGLAFAIFIIFLYWTLVYEGGSVHPITWHTHGVEGGMILIEWFTSTWQLTYRGAISTSLTALTWVILSIVFYVCGWTNEYDGERYIYSVINWGESPLSSFGYSCVVIAIVPFFHVILVYLKNLIIKQWVSSQFDNNEEKMVVVIQHANDENNDNTNNSKQNPKGHIHIPAQSKDIDDI